MAYVLGRIGRVIAIRWRGFEVGDLARARKQIADARMASPTPLVYLSLIPADSRTFSNEERDELLAFVKDLLSDCESIHHVIDGDGFVASARRSIVTNLAIATSRPQAFRTYATLEDAMREIARRIGESEEDLVREARAQKLAFRAR